MSYKIKLKNKLLWNNIFVILWTWITVVKLSNFTAGYLSYNRVSSSSSHFKVDSVDELSFAIETCTGFMWTSVFLRAGFIFYILTYNTHTPTSLPSIYL